MAISYYKTVLNIGVQLLAMILLVGIGQQFISQYYSQMDTNMNLDDMAAMFVASSNFIGSRQQNTSHDWPYCPRRGNSCIRYMDLGTGSAIAAAGVAGAAAAMASNAV